MQCLKNLRTYTSSSQLGATWLTNGRNLPKGIIWQENSVLLGFIDDSAILAQSNFSTWAEWVRSL